MQNLVKRLLIKAGILFDHYSESSFRPILARETKVWKDGTPLITGYDRDTGVLTADPRTTSNIGKKLYKVADGDERLVYFEWVFPNDIIQMRDVGITPELANCSPLWDELSNYFPPQLPQSFEFQPGATYNFLDGMVLNSRAHHISSPNPRKLPNLNVNGGRIGFHSFGANGTIGAWVRNLNFNAVGPPVADGVKDENGVVYPDTDVRSDDPYSKLFHGTFIQNVVHMENIGLNGFTGIGIYVLGIINAGNPFSNNTSLSTFDRIRFGGLGSDCVLVYGADANHMRFTNLDCRDCVGFAITDDSLLGNHYDFVHMNNTRRGTVRARGAGNSSTFKGMYSEEIQAHLTLPSTDKEKGYGAYLHGSAIMIGGTMSPEGSSLPGSKVYCYDNAQCVVGRITSGISTGTVSISGAGMYYGGGLTFAPNPVSSPAGFDYLLGGQFAGGMGQYSNVGVTLRNGARRVAQVETANYHNPHANGIGVIMVPTYKDVATAKRTDGSPYEFYPGDEVQCQFSGPWVPGKLRCVQGGKFMDNGDYTTTLTGQVAQVQDGSYPFIVNGTDPLPAIGSTVTLNGVGHYLIINTVPENRYLYFDQFNPGIADFGTRTIGYAKPKFQPLGAGIGTGPTPQQPDQLGQQPDLTGLVGPWQYYNTTLDALQTWTGSKWV